MNINSFMPKETKKQAFVLINVLLLITTLISLTLFQIQLIQIEADNVQAAKQISDELVFKREVFEKLYRKLEEDQWIDEIKVDYSFKKIDDCYILVTVLDEEFSIYHPFTPDKK